MPKERARCTGRCGVTVELILGSQVREYLDSAASALRHALEEALDPIEDEPSRGAPGRYEGSGYIVDLSVKDHAIVYRLVSHGRTAEVVRIQAVRF